MRMRLLCTQLIVRRCQRVGFQTLGTSILIACHWFLLVPQTKWCIVYIYNIYKEPT